MDSPPKLAADLNGRLEFASHADRPAVRRHAFANGGHFPRNLDRVSLHGTGVIRRLQLPGTFTQPISERPCSAPPARRSVVVSLQVPGSSSQIPVSVGAYFHAINAHRCLALGRGVRGGWAIPVDSRRDGRARGRRERRIRRSGRLQLCGDVPANGAASSGAGLDRGLRLHHRLRPWRRGGLRLHHRLRPRNRPRRPGGPRRRVALSLPPLRRSGIARPVLPPVSAKRLRHGPRLARRRHSRQHLEPRQPFQWALQCPGSGQRAIQSSLFRARAIAAER